MKHKKKGLAKLNARPLFKIRQLQCLLYLSFLLNMIFLASLLSIVKLLPFLLGFFLTLCVFVMVACVVRFVYGYK